VDGEVLAASLDFIDRQHRDRKPFMLWFNTTRMHVWTHLKKESEGKTGLGIYPDGMVEHDGHVGQVLKKLDDLGIANNTIVIYTTDNGAEAMSWPDGGTPMHRGEKNTNWEGGYRVPAMVRWPGLVRPGTIINDIFAHEDWLTTIMAAVGEPQMADKLKKGETIGGKTYKAHLDGYDQRELLAKGNGNGKRKEFIYFTDDGNVAAVRYDHWKMVFMEQRGHGFDVWQEPLVTLRLPKLFNLRTDPFERADHEGMGYSTWRFDRAFLLAPASAYVGQWLQSFREFPPRQKPGSFNLSQVMEKLSSPAGSN
jgi:arylsulfatase